MSRFSTVFLGLLPALIPPPLNPNASLPLLCGSVTLGAGAQIPRKRAASPPPPPRPRQGGERISEELLKRMGNSECLWQFRMTAEELVTMTRVLKLPEPVQTRSGSCFTALEALALTLARFRSSGDIYDLVRRFDRCESAISEVVTFVVRYVDETWHHLLEFDHDHLLSPPNLERYAAAVHHAGAPLRGVYGFIDCTLRRIARPSRFQRVAFNGHKKYHALKFQAIMLPNGMFGHLYGPVEGRRNDLALLEDSHLMDMLRKYAVREGTDENTPAQARFLQLFGDPAYGLSRHIISPFAGPDRTEEELAWNDAMSSVRTTVENGFAIVLKTWPHLNVWWKLAVYTSPVGLHYRFGVLMANAINCMRPNQVAVAFDCRPPDLQEYFHD